LTGSGIRVKTASSKRRNRQSCRERKEGARDLKILITGGYKSGKSSFALQKASAQSARTTFIATAEPIDEEMRQRIARHRAQRDDRYITIEEPLEIHKHAQEDVLLDCLTLWVNNLLFYRQEARWEAVLTAFLDGLGRNAVIVTNEVGLGNIPPDPKTRRYNELLGKTNLLVASRMDEVYLMVSGQALRVK
jgi:adenosyl cobinamide kinase/adenosyl cobinamide phosphate guanylyltransferase